MIGILYAVGAVASALAAALAWLAKVLWAREYAAAKDEVIRAKEAQIDVLKEQLANLRELTPMKIREYFLSVKEQLEEYVDNLRTDLANARGEIGRMTEEITGLKAEGVRKTADIRQLENQRDEAVAAASALETKVDALTKASLVASAPPFFRVPSFDPALLDGIQQSQRRLAVAMQTAGRQYSSSAWQDQILHINRAIHDVLRLLSEKPEPQKDGSSGSNESDA